MAYRDVTVTESYVMPTKSVVSQSSLVFDFDFLTGNYREVDVSSIEGNGTGGGSTRPTSGLVYPRRED